MSPNSKRNFFLVQWLIFAAAVALLLIIGGGRAYHERGHVVEMEQQRLLATAGLLQVAIEQDLVGVNEVLGELAREVSRGGGGTDLGRRLKTLADSMAAVRTINVHDAAATIRQSSRAELVGLNANFTEREYFAAPRRQPNADVLFVSAPFVTTTGVHAFAVSRMVPGPRGEFTGAIVATLDPQYFQPLLDAARYAPDMTASLHHGDGVLYQMSPLPADGLGRDRNILQPGSPFLRHRESARSSSVDWDMRVIDSAERVLVQRDIRPASLKIDKALVIAVSRAQHEVFADWRHDVEITAGLLAASLLLLGGGLFLHQRSAGKALRAEAAATAALAESEVRFRMLFENLGDAILVHPVPLGKFVDVNAAACERLGYSREELLQLGPPDIDAPAVDGGPPVDQAAVIETLAREGQVRFERVHRGRDGRGIPVEILTRIVELGGQPHAISIARDISARKAAEQRAQDSEVRLRALIEANRQSAILIRLDGTILAMNTVAARRLGGTPETLLGRDIYSLFPPHVAETRRRRLLQGAAQGIADVFEDERNGMRFRHSLVPIKDAAGAVTQVAIFAEDITEATLLRHVDALLHGFDQQVLGGRNLFELLRYACEQLVQRFGFEVVWVGRKMADGSVHVLHAAGNARDYVSQIQDVGVRWDDTPTGHGPAGVTIRSGEAQVFHASDADFSPWSRLAAGYGLRTMLGLPLIVRGEVFGAMILYAKDPDAFSRDETVSQLRHVGARLNVVVDMAEKQQQMQLLRLAIETAGSGIMVTRRDATIEWTNRALRQMTGYAETELIGRTPRLFKSGIQEADYYDRFWHTLSVGDTWRGELVNKRKNGSLFTVTQAVAPVRDLSGEVSHYVSVMEDISARKEAEERIRHLAQHDALTDLPNRVLMQERLTRMLIGEKRRGHELIGVLYLDLDRFKQVNDTHGHDVGDALLRGFAERLRGVVRGEDTVARVGGDEFVVLLPGMQETADAEAVARKILASLTVPIDCLGVVLQAATSIGIAHAPAHGSEPVPLLKCADQAMYAAKQAGRNTYAVFGGAFA